MKKKPISKFTIKREVISNLSKKSQGLFLGGYGGYGEGGYEDWSFQDVGCPIVTVNPQKSCLFINCQPPSPPPETDNCTYDHETCYPGWCC